MQNNNCFQSRVNPLSPVSIPCTFFLVSVCRWHQCTLPTHAACFSCYFLCTFWRCLKYHAMTFQIKFCPFYWYVGLCILSNFLYFMTILIFKEKYGHFNLSFSVVYPISFTFWVAFLNFFLKLKIPRFCIYLFVSYLTMVSSSKYIVLDDRMIKE
jgi:hypothetical protein